VALHVPDGPHLQVAVRPVVRVAEDPLLDLAPPGQAQLTRIGKSTLPLKLMDCSISFPAASRQSSAKANHLLALYVDSYVWLKNLPEDRLFSFCTLLCVLKSPSLSVRISLGSRRGGSTEMEQSKKGVWGCRGGVLHDKRAFESL
jgi:hypothetical protein